MKRQDIQLLRGIAVICVIIFHISPKNLPNGKFGVDIFFVISGFLICSILSQENEQKLLPWLLQFYFRRLKRLLPLAYTTFAMSFMTMYILGTTILFSVNQSSGFKVLFFSGNLKMTVEDDYGNQLAEGTALFTHYWSLAVEVQFYLLAPLVIAASWRISTERKFVLTVSLALMSFVHFISSSSTIAFNCPLARKWQFLAGFLAFYGKRIFDGYKGTFGKTNKVIHVISSLAVSTMSICVFYEFPGKAQEDLTRLAVTTTTSWIIFAERSPEFPCLKPLTFIGDISYVLYLVHWPVICFVQHYAKVIPLLEANSVIIVVGLSFSISIVLHKLLEVPLLSVGDVGNAIAIILLFSFCAVMVRTNIFDSTNPRDTFFDTAIQHNQKNQRRMLEHNHTYAVPYLLQGIGQQVLKYPDGAGNLSFLIVGNDYCINQADIIYHHMKRLSKKFFLSCHAYCETLVHTNFSKCYKNQSEDVVEFLKPDVLFIVERGRSIKEKIDSVHMDSLMTAIRNKLSIWAQWSKLIYILGALPNLVTLPATKAISYLRRKQRLRDSRSLAIHDHFYQKRRLAEIPSFCAKCNVLDWDECFFDGRSIFQAYDERTDIMLFDDNQLLTREGIGHITSMYRDVAKQIEERALRSSLVE